MSLTSFFSRDRDSERNQKSIQSEAPEETKPNSGPDEHQLTALQTEIKMLKEREKRKDAELKRRSSDLEALQQRLHTTEQDNRRLGESCREWEDHARRLHAECHDQREELTREKGHSAQLGQRLSALERERGDIHDLLESRTSELKEAQRFLLKTDSVSDAEVLQILQYLNAEVSHTATAITDAVQRQRGHQRGTIDECSTTQGVEIERIVGPALTHLLATKTHADDPICIQLAIQACLSALVRWAVETWDPKRPLRPVIISKIFESIKREESQVISASWRVLARCHLNKVAPTEELAEILMAAILEHTSGILLKARMHGTRSELCEDIRKRYGGQLKSIITRTLILREAIGEKVVSSNLNIISARDGRSFDANRMEDEFNGGRSVDREATRCKVLCTVQLGLERVNGRDSHHGGLTHAVVLLKAKTVLESAVVELQQD